MPLFQVNPHQDPVDLFLKRINRQKTKRKRYRVLAGAARLEFLQQHLKGGYRGGPYPGSLGPQPVFECVGASIHSVEKIA